MYSNKDTISSSDNRIILVDGICYLSGRHPELLFDVECLTDNHSVLSFEPLDMKINRRYVSLLDVLSVEKMLRV